MIAIGDIAGNFKTLKALLDKLPNKKVILLGDPNDRGPRSNEVIQFIMDNQDKLTDYLKEFGMGDIWGICLDTCQNQVLTALDLDTMTLYTQEYID